MEKMVVRSLLGLFVCLSMAACGTSKDNAGAPVHVGTNAKTQQLPQSQQQSPTAAKPAATPQSATKPSAKDNSNDQSQQPDPDFGKPAAKPAASAPAKKEKQNPMPTSDDTSVGQLTRMRAESDKYTGSADDYLRNFLVSKESNASEAQQNRDLQTANNVRSATLKIDYKADDGGGSGDALLTLNISQQGKDSTLTLATTINNGRGRLKSTSSKVAVKGEVICMDADATTCETAVADLVVGSKSKAALRIIFRRTDVQLNAHFPNKNCATQECEDIYTMFSETAAVDRGTLTSPDRLIISKAKMESFEVINGRSGFRVVINTIGHEVIAFGGPLFNQDLMAEAAVKVPADRTISAEDQVNFATGQNYKTRLNNTLKDIRIVGNDGLGAVTLDVTVEGQRRQALQDQFPLEVVRKSKPLRPMVGMDLTK